MYLLLTQTKPFMSLKNITPRKFLFSCKENGLVSERWLSCIFQFSKLKCEDLLFTVCFFYIYSKIYTVRNIQSLNTNEYNTVLLFYIL